MRGCAACRGAPSARRSLGALWRHPRYSPVGSPLICFRRPCPIAFRRSARRSSVMRPVAPAHAASLACDFAMPFDRRAAAVSAPVVSDPYRAAGPAGPDEARPDRMDARYRPWHRGRHRDVGRHHPAIAPVTAAVPTPVLVASRPILSQPPAIRALAPSGSQRLRLAQSVARGGDICAGPRLFPGRPASWTAADRRRRGRRRLGPWAAVAAFKPARSLRVLAC